jgi:hypothetical protein
MRRSVSNDYVARAGVKSKFDIGFPVTLSFHRRYWASSILRSYNPIPYHSKIRPSGFRLLALSLSLEREQRKKDLKQEFDCLRTTSTVDM